MLVELSPMLSPYSRYSYWPWGLPRPRIRRAREPARNSKIIWCRDDPSKSTTVLALIPTFLAILTFLGTAGGGRASSTPVSVSSASVSMKTARIPRAGTGSSANAENTQSLRKSTTRLTLWWKTACTSRSSRSEEHTSELQSHHDLVCRLLLEKKKTNVTNKVAHEIMNQRGSLKARSGRLRSRLHESRE